ncbi:MAG: hypothetical protein M5U09_09370 [Gammaproteobacteria bacterium]|nr:hypothetical protein [Gammaproteobacteria bacterium]
MVDGDGAARRGHRGVGGAGHRDPRSRTGARRERAYPRSPGAEHCRVVREQIEAPSYDLRTMTIDAADRRSLEITHHNLAALYLRAYRLPDERFDAKPVTWAGWNRTASADVLPGARPPRPGSSGLPATADYRDHPRTPPGRRSASAAAT